MGDRKEEVVTTPLLEKKSSTNDVDEGTDELVDMPLLEKKSLTKDVDKGTYELADIEQVVVKIRMKGLDKFEGESKGYTGWFKLDSGFLKQMFLQFIQNYIKNCFKIILKTKTRNYIQRLLHCLINNLSRQNMKKRTKHYFSIRITSTRRNRTAQTSKRYIFFVRINGRNRFNRRNNSKCNARKTNSKEEYIYNP